MKILLYGGTFDPPHNGHMNNLRAALALVQPDRALVMPAGTPPHKHASATPAELRLQMCACFTALSPAVQVSDWEIRRGGRSYTVHTLEWLRGQDPDGALYLCVGSDMLLTFQEWYRWQDMLKMAALSRREPHRHRRGRPARRRRRTEKGRGPRPFCPCRELPLRVERHPQREDPAGAVAAGAAAGGAGSDKGASAVREPVGRPAPRPPRRARAPRPTRDPKRLLCRGRACPARSIKIHHPFKGNQRQAPRAWACPAPTASQERGIYSHGVRRSQEAW